MSNVPYRDALPPLLRPSVRIQTRTGREQSLAPGRSKIGGAPDLPRGVQWPTVLIPWKLRDDPLLISVLGKHCLRQDGLLASECPLPFVGQINLAEVAPYDGQHELPDHGLLSFFADIQLDIVIDLQRVFPWGKEDWRAWKVIYTEDLSDLSRAPVPASFSAAQHYTPCALSFRPEWMLPDAESPLIRSFFTPRPEDQTEENSPGDTLDISPELEQIERHQDLLTIIAEIQDREYLGDGPAHRLLGYDEPIQNDVPHTLSAVCGFGPMPANAADKEAPTDAPIPIAPDQWCLLFQLDTDPAANMMWGDAGRLFFCLTREDLAARRFDLVRGLLQQY